MPLFHISGGGFAGPAGRWRKRGLPILVGAGLLLGGGCSSPETDRPGEPAAAEAEAPLLLDDAAPLLLGDGPEWGAPLGEGAADNSRCQVCHLNLVGEPLAREHALAGIGCADCHGASDAHIADESWASGGNGTAPDTMFPRARINPACFECHAQDQLDPEQHRDFLAGQTKEQVCTECHGQHRLVNRKCKWK